MKFKIDENLPIEVAELLRQAGHDAATVFDEKLGGEIDRTIAAVCRLEQRAIITLDIDFADIRTYPPSQYAGLIILRTKQQDKPFILALIARIIPQFAHEPLSGKLWIVDEQRIRIRE